MRSLLNKIPIFISSNQFLLAFFDHSLVALLCKMTIMILCFGWLTARMTYLSCLGKVVCINWVSVTSIIILSFLQNAKFLYDPLLNDGNAGHLKMTDNIENWTIHSFDRQNSLEIINLIIERYSYKYNVSLNKKNRIKLLFFDGVRCRNQQFL